MALLKTLRYILQHPLSRSSGLQALNRFVKWQIASRLASGGVVCPWVNGSKFIARRGDAGLTGNIYVGLHEFAEMGFLLHTIRREDVFVDVGANAGSFTLLACAAVGARGYAFEPVPGTFKKLMDNIRINNIQDRVRTINKAVGAQNGTLSFSVDSDTTNRVLAPDEHSDGSMEVEITTLDAELADDSPTLMKIDVEGFETQVIQGASRVLDRPSLHAVIMELGGNGSRYGFDESKIPGKMAAHGFSPYSYDPLSRSLAAIDASDPRSQNTIFVRDQIAVLERIRSAPQIQMLGRSF